MMPSSNKRGFEPKSILAILTLLSASLLIATCGDGLLTPIVERPGDDDTDNDGGDDTGDSTDDMGSDSDTDSDADSDSDSDSDSDTGPNLSCQRNSGYPCVCDKGIGYCDDGSRCLEPRDAQFGLCSKRCDEEDGEEDHTCDDVRGYGDWEYLNSNPDDPGECYLDAEDIVPDEDPHEGGRYEYCVVICNPHAEYDECPPGMECHRPLSDFEKFSLCWPE